MPKLGRNGLKLLKLVHLFAASCWVGGAVSLLVLNIHNESAFNGSVLYGINSAAAAVDWWVVVICGAYGCLITGIVYGLFSNWGFFRHRWLIAKWIITVTAILTGTFFLGKFEATILAFSRDLGLASFYNRDFAVTRSMHLMGGLLQLTCLLAAVGISVFKPWKRTGKTLLESAREHEALEAKHD